MAHVRFIGRKAQNPSEIVILRPQVILTSTDLVILLSDSNAAAPQLTSLDASCLPHLIIADYDMPGKSGELIPKPWI